MGWGGPGAVDPDPSAIGQSLEHADLEAAIAAGKPVQFEKPGALRAADLRRSCPCAQCVNEWTGQRVLKPESISENIEIRDLSIVGRYALNFRWSDGHETGIYSFRYLRELCESQGAES